MSLLPQRDDWIAAAKLAAPWLTPEQIEAMYQDFLKHREDDDE